MSRSNNSPPAPTLAARAARLPAPEPGKPLTIPLELAPAWLQLHQRELVRYDAQRLLYLGQRAAPQTYEKDPQ